MFLQEFLGSRLLLSCQPYVISPVDLKEDSSGAILEFETLWMEFGTILVLQTHRNTPNGSKCNTPNSFIPKSQPWFMTYGLQFTFLFAWQAPSGRKPQLFWRLRLLRVRL